MAYVEGAYSIANGQYSHAEGYRNVAKADSWEQMANALHKLNMGVNTAASNIQNLQQILYNQLGTASSVMTEKPKQKSDLEISNRIEISEDFLNLKIDN